VSYAEAFKRADIKPNDVGDLLDIMLQTINTLLIARGLAEQHFNPLPLEHVKALLNAI
jgi:hypothetical protein